MSICRFSPFYLSFLATLLIFLTSRSFLTTVVDGTTRFNRPGEQGVLSPPSTLVLSVVEKDTNPGFVKNFSVTFCVKTQTKKISSLVF